MDYFFKPCVISMMLSADLFTNLHMCYRFRLLYLQLSQIPSLITFAVYELIIPVLCFLWETCSQKLENKVNPCNFQNGQSGYKYHMFK